jgi:hypothetical protein
MQGALSISAGNQVLNSWKEIAQYLERGVRTVQRWETDLALPVRRPRGKKRSAVIAMRSDLDDWLNSCPSMQSRNGNSAPGTKPLGPASAMALQIPVSEAILHSRHLRSNVRQSSHELAGAIGRLVSTINTVVNAREADQLLLGANPPVAAEPGSYPYY